MRVSLLDFWKKKNRRKQGKYSQTIMTPNVIKFDHFWQHRSVFLKVEMTSTKLSNLKFENIPQQMDQSHRNQL